MKSVIVIAGTADSRQVITELTRCGFRVIATVATGFGKELLSEYQGVEIREGRLGSEDMKLLIKETEAVCLVDASHPFAREVSLNALGACRELDLPYLRYEREEVDSDDSNIVHAVDFEEAAQIASRLDGNILLTTGSNTLGIFVNSIPDYKKRLFARVLPESGVIRKCEDLGLSANNIIAMKGPFTESMNIETIRYTNASVLVTKDSGTAGGTREKLDAAKKMGISVIMIEKPRVQYSNIVKEINQVTAFVTRIADFGGIG